MKVIFKHSQKCIFERKSNSFDFPGSLRGSIIQHAAHDRNSLKNVHESWQARYAFSTYFKLAAFFNNHCCVVCIKTGTGKRQRWTDLKYRNDTIKTTPTLIRQFVQLFQLDEMQRFRRPSCVHDTETRNVLYNLADHQLSIQTFPFSAASLVSCNNTHSPRNLS